MIPFLAAALVVLLADRAANAIVRQRLAEGRVAWSGGPVEIRALRAHAAALSRRDRGALLMLFGATLAGIVLQVREGALFDGEVARIGLGSAVGGALANVYDRVRRGSVLDFVKVGGWPVFNVADVGITCGTIAALWAVW